MVGLRVQLLSLVMLDLYSIFSNLLSDWLGTTSL